MRFLIGVGRGRFMRESKARAPRPAYRGARAFRFPHGSPKSTTSFEVVLFLCMRFLIGVGRKAGPCGIEKPGPASSVPRGPAFRFPHGSPKSTTSFEVVLFLCMRFLIGVGRKDSMRNRKSPAPRPAYRGARAFRFPHGHQKALLHLR